MRRPCEPQRRRRVSHSRSVRISYETRTITALRLYDRRPYVLSSKERRQSLARTERAAERPHRFSFGIRWRAAVDLISYQIAT